MVSLVKLIGFLIQVIVCPVVMLPWLFIRLIIVMIPAKAERHYEERHYMEMDITAAPAFA